MATKKTKMAEEKAKISLKQISIAVALSFIVAGSIYILTSFATKVFYEAPRAARVHEMYDSLQLSDDYVYQGGAIAGERRIYKQDGTRSWSSYAHYLRGANVDATVAELDQHIKDAGFRLIYQSDKVSLMVEHHYENDQGEFIRVMAHSKLRLEYFQNAHLMGETLANIEANAVDANQGPTMVTIKVNLDNNNE